MTSAAVMERGSPQAGDATHAVAANGMFYGSANAGWDKVDDHGPLKPGKHFSAPVRLRFTAK
jgi:hypothetical protein